MTTRVNPPAWTLAVTAMLSVQLGSALSTDLIAQVGPAGTAWLRLSFGALVFIAIARPSVRTIRRADVPFLLALGVTTGLQTTAFLAAIERIPLGTCVAIEFLGPLTIAGLRAHHRRTLVWPLLALVGVVLLTEPWAGSVDFLGVTFAVAAAFGWALYIVFTQHVGDRFDGIDGLAFTTPIAAVTAAVIGIPQAAGHLDLAAITVAIGLALLLPVLPYACELLALRRMTTSAFGTLMAVEPAIGVLLGALLLAQSPTPLQIIGVVLVVAAGAAAQRGSRRAQPASDELALRPDIGAAVSR